MLDLCDLNVMRPLLEAQGFSFSKAKGQNFLTAAWVPERIAQEAELDANTGVLEIGPGFGCLTQRLCLRAGKVAAVELDRRLRPVLDRTVGEFANLELIWGDILEMDIPGLVRERFPGLRPAACANLPYYITSPVLTALLEADCFDTVTVMVQREVAERIAAAPGTGAYGALSVFCRYHAQPELLFKVPPDCFVPRPKVTSQVLRLRVRKERPWDIEDRDHFFRTVRASFAMRRKTLRNCLSAAFPALGREGVEAAIRDAGLDPGVRGETLDIPAFAALSNAILRRESHV